MLIIPAIDLKGGRCVRLRQGKADSVETFSNDPVSVAQTWETLGAKLIHLVDLDGAFKGKLQNLPLIKAIVKAVRIPVQLGGGLRDSREINRAFKAGVERIVLGTRAFESPDLIKKLIKKYGQKILVAVDSSNGKLAIRGWEKKVNLGIIDFIKEMKDSGVKNFVFTDIKRDGMMRGPNIALVKEILSKVNPVRKGSSLMTGGGGHTQRLKSLAFSNGVKVKLIASGGISSKGNLKKLKRLEKKGLAGVIIGRALYTGALKLEEAIEIGSRS